MATKPLSKPWLLWGTKRTENGYYSWSHILDFQFLLLSCKRSHFYWSTVIQITPQTCENITITDNLAVKPLYLWVTRSSEVYDSRSQRLDANFLSLNSTTHHMSWSIIIQMAPDNVQKHTRDQSLSCGDPWLFRSNWRKWRIWFWPPDSASRHSAATQHPLS